MIDSLTLKKLADGIGIDSFSVLREIAQIAFLNELFSLPGSQQIFFKGGTALKLMFGSNRFSEDLDFTVGTSKPLLERLAIKAAARLKPQYPDIVLKDVESAAGVSKKIWLPADISTQPLTIKLDFSFREKVLRPKQGTIKSGLPVAAVTLINYVDPAEVLAEKYRAILTRTKGRDLYDVWYLLNRKVVFELKLIKQKLNYYKEKYEPKKFVDKIAGWPEKNIVEDVRRFLPRRDREVLTKLKSLVLEAIEESNLR